MTQCKEINFSASQMNSELANFFSSLLTEKKVAAIMLPLRQANGGVMQSLVTDPAALVDAEPFAPVVPINAAKIASSLTATPSGKKIALVMRSCEIRAMVELGKLNQAGFEQTVVIGIDCLGRYSNADYKSFVAAGGNTESFLAGAASDYEVAPACAICEFPTAAGADIQLGVIGVGSGVVIAEAITEKGGELLGESMGETPAGRGAAVASLVAEREAKRDAAFAQYRNEKGTFAALEAHFADCVNCYNCRVACPVCYCKECVFVTDTFRHTGEQFLNWAVADGSMKMPAETLFFHLTRISHVATTCVGCGQCSSACPNGIDLMPVFRTAAEVGQARFGYQAGRSHDEAQPLSVFEDDELVEVTGQVK